MKTTIVATTIQTPHAMRQIADNTRDYGHKELDFIVIGDRETPSSVADFCARIRHDFYPAEYLDLDAQSRFLAPKLQVLLKHLCFNSRQRRNVGIFCAWQNALSGHSLLANRLAQHRRRSGRSQESTLLSSWFPPVAARKSRAELPRHRIGKRGNSLAFSPGRFRSRWATRIDYEISTMARRSIASFAFARGTSPHRHKLSRMLWSNRRCASRCMARNSPRLWCRDRRPQAVPRWIGHLERDFRCRTRKRNCQII